MSKPRTSTGRVVFTALIVGLSIAAVISSFAHGRTDAGIAYLGGLAGWATVLMIRAGWWD